MVQLLDLDLEAHRTVRLVACSRPQVSSERVVAYLSCSLPFQYLADNRAATSAAPIGLKLHLPSLQILCTGRQLCREALVGLQL